MVAVAMLAVERERAEVIRDIYSHGQTVWLMNSWWLWVNGGDADRMYLATGRSSANESAAFEETVLDFATLSATADEAEGGEYVRAFYRDTAPLIDLETGFFILGGKKRDRIERSATEAAKLVGLAGDEQTFRRRLHLGEQAVIAKMRGLEVDPTPAVRMDSFMALRTRREKDASARMLSLYGAYVDSCTSAGFQAGPRRWFEDRLRASGLTAKRVPGESLRAWADIRLL